MRTRRAGDSAPAALDGLRVLDLAGPIGAYCAKLWADLGADVVRVEPPGGDPARRIGPFYEDSPGLERSLFHWHFNANKRGITLDLEKQDGRVLFKRLAESADVVVETFNPGYLDSLGLGYEHLAAINPRIVLTSITPFGQTGPYRDYLGEELVGQAAGGLLWLCGWPDRPPVMMGGWPAMHQASAEAAAATLVALEAREQTGRGQQVDASLQGGLPLSLMASIAEFHATGQQRSRLGDYHPGPLNGMFACSDGYADFRFRARPGRWERIVAWMDSVSLAEDLGEARYRDTAYRRQPENQRHVDEVFQRFIVRFTREEAMDVGQRTGIEVGAVYTAEDLLGDPQLEARQFFQRLEHEDLGRSFLYPGAPYLLAETPWRLRRRAPLLGEHNVELPRIWGNGARRGEGGVTAKVPDAPVANNPLPLAGLRVIDFTQHAAGPLASKFLADYGAEVILVESEAYITTGGGSRQTGPPGVSPINTAWFHNKFNSNKLSVTVDLNRDEGKQIVKSLLAVSDVMIANVRPQALEKLDLTYEAVRAVRPDIIYLTMPTMGVGGPRSFYGGVSWGIQAMAGLNAISGYADCPPTSPTPYSHPDVSCNPLHAAVAIMAALGYRRRTGRGQMIELSQYESSICWTGPAILQYTANGTLMERSENRRPGAAPHDVFRCQGEDRWCAISVFDDQQWRALCTAIGRPELAYDPSYASTTARDAHLADFHDILEPWTTQRAAEEVMRVLQAAGVPCAVVNDFHDLLRRDPQFQARGYWTEVEHPELGTAVVEGWGFHLSETERVPPARAPLLGENNDYVFQEVLGMSEDEVNTYLVEGVLR